MIRCKEDMILIVASASAAAVLRLAENLWNWKNPPGTADERCGIWKRARNESARRINMIGADDAAGSVVIRSSDSE
ncbi:hypothetical protein AXG93_3545s1330 [Marchantia polymorpha subsp. ruderalis]|uniref:Uncharacterized protein n=1 Tax=Marchantia polymorpha subsp. ruderalis TaxID=1480154 RepID=A0A176VW40_MARPO|nr:hypothetical protein AXG93_3545s1330 [Marchantia polymorpha subsp. ruderalis]